MKKSQKLHAIRVYLLINAAVVFSTLIDFLMIPTDPKNAWLLGFSRPRILGVAILLFVTVGYVLLAYRHLFTISRAEQAVKSFQNHLGKLWLFDIYLFLSVVLFIFSAMLGARFRDYPESASNSYVIIRAYPFVAWILVFALTTFLLLLLFRHKRNSGLSISTSWLNTQLAKRNVEVIVLFAIVLIFLMFGRSYISNEKIISDNLEAVRNAYFLRKSGSIARGRDENGIPVPTARREPLPAVAGAVNLIINPAFWKDYTLSDINNGSLTVPFKSINLFWSSLFLLSLYFFAKRIFENSLTAIMISSALSYFVIIRSSHFDGNFHEVAAASLTVLASLLFIRLFKKPGRVNGILFGFSLGLLALTKASVFYVGVVYFLVVAVAFQMTKRLNKEMLVVLFLALLAFALPPLGWMTRNKIQFDSFALSERGGDVLYHRILNTRHSMWGLMYAFSPPIFRDIISEFTSFTKDDILEGGRLGALITGNPSYIQYHRKDIYNQMLIDARSAGAIINTRLEFDNFLLKQAFTEIRNDPQAYLRGTPGIAWRGIWGLQPEQYGFESSFGQDVLLPVINLTIFVSFVLFIPYALLNRNYMLATVFIFPLGIFLFNALLSHNQRRFNYSIEPYLWLGTLVLVFDGLALASSHKRIISKNVND